MITLTSAAKTIGTENAFTVLKRAAELNAEGRAIINLGIGQPDFPTPPHIVEAGIKALKDGHHGYTPAGGIAPLREAVAADVHARYKTGIPADAVQILPGAKPVIFFAALLLGEPGAEIIHPDPGFPIYESAIAFSGAKPVGYPLHEDKGFAFSAADVLSRITERTRLIIINSPANPTGGVTPRSEIAALVEGLEAHPHVALMSDEIYDKLVFDGYEMTSLLEFESIRDRLIILNGWSKAYAMTGWRLGYAIWPQSMREAAERIATNCHSCVNASAQHAGIAALTGAQDCVEDMRRAFMRRAALMVEALNKLPGITARAPGGAFYVFANITGTGRAAADLQHMLLEEAGVAVIAGTSFGRLGEGFMRISCANSDEAILEAIGKIGDHLQK